MVKNWLSQGSGPLYQPKRKPYQPEPNKELENKYIEMYKNMSPEEKERRRIARHERYMQNRELEMLQVKLYKQRHPEMTKEYARRSHQRRKERLAAETLKKDDNKEQ